MPIEVGQILSGKITGITNFGAFIELGEGVTGLVHISEVADFYVKDINHFYKVNDVVRVKVLSMEKGKIALSIKQTENSPRPKKPAQSQLTFEDKLAKFMKDSDERQSDLKKSIESKRGGRGGGSRLSL